MVVLFVWSKGAWPQHKCKATINCAGPQPSEAQFWSRVVIPHQCSHSVNVQPWLLCCCTNLVRSVCTTHWLSHGVVVQHGLSVHTRAHKLCAHWMGAANCRLQWLGCVGTQERQIGVSKGACLEWLGWDGNKGALSFQLSIGLSQPYDQEPTADCSDIFF